MEELSSPKLGINHFLILFIIDFMSSQRHFLRSDNNPNLVNIQRELPSELIIEDEQQSVKRRESDFIKKFQRKGKKRFEKMNAKDYSLALPKLNNRMTVIELKKPRDETILYKLKIKSFAKKFIQNLKNHSLQRKTDDLLDYQFQLINDKSDINSIGQQDEIDKRIALEQKRKKEQILRLYPKYQPKNDKKKFKIPVIRQSSQILFIWNIIVMLCTLYNFYTIPLRFIFQQQFFQSECKFKLLINSQLVVFIIDILLKCNTSIIEKDQLIYNRKSIILHYIKSKKLIIDLITFSAFLASSRPFYTLNCDLFVTQYELVWGFLFYLKYLKFSKLLKKVGFTIRNQQQAAFIHLIRLMINFFIIAHYVACFWLLTGQNSHETENWLFKYQINQQNWVTQYITSLYFSLMTMTTVGYGDIVPQNDIEKVVNMLMMVLACAAFGYIINQISGIIADLEDRSIECSKELNVINRYMENYNIDQDLRIKIRNHLKTQWKTNMLSQFDVENEVIKKLSKSLREDIRKDYLGQMIQQVPLFLETFSENFLTSLALKMEKHIFAPDEQIIGNGEQKLMFIGLGKAKFQFKSNKNTVKLRSLNKGDYYGLQDIFQINDNPNTNIGVVAHDYVIAYQINKSGFLELLEQYPDDYERYCYIRDTQLLLNSELCIVCGQKDHDIDDCPIVHYAPNKKWVLHKSQYSKPQERNEQLRRLVKSMIKGMQIYISEKGKINTLKNFGFFKYKAEIYQQGMGEESLRSESEQSNNEECGGYVQESEQSQYSSIKRKGGKKNTWKSEIKLQESVQTIEKKEQKESKLNVDLLKKNLDQFIEEQISRLSGKSQQLQTSSLPVFDQKNNQKKIKQEVFRDVDKEHIDSQQMDNVYLGRIYNPKNQLQNVIKKVNKLAYAKRKKRMRSIISKRMLNK